MIIQFLKKRESILLWSVIAVFFAMPQQVYAACDNPITCEEVSTFSPNSEPKALSEFRDGCYGLDTADLTPILHNEDDTSVGFFYLVKNSDYVEGSIVNPYNIVLCDERKIDNPQFLSFREFFPQTQESLDNGETFDEYLRNVLTLSIKDSINGNFSVKITPTFIMLFKSKKLFFEDTTKRYRLSNVSFFLTEDVTRLISTPSIVVALQANGSIPKPSLYGLSLYEKCKILPASIFCSITTKHRTSTEDIYSYTFSTQSNRENRDGNVVVTIQSLENLIALEKNASPDGSCTDGKMPNEYLEFDSVAFRIYQKPDVVIPSGVSCTVRVSVLDFPSSLANVSSENILAEREEQTDGVYFAAGETLVADSSLVFDFIVESYTPTVGTVAVSDPISSSSSTSSSSGSGGSYVDTIERLRTGVGYRTIGEEAEATADEKILVCPEEKYIRYADQRGLGVSIDLFKDVDSTHRAYNSLIDLAEQRIVNGDNATGDARLDSVISRAEFVKIMTIAREDILLLGDCLKVSRFLDVHFTDWFTPFVQNLEVKSIVKGYDGNLYKPGQSINIAESYKVLALSFGYISLEEAEKIAYERGVEWYVPYGEVLEKSGVIPSWLFGVDKDSALERGDVFVILSSILLQKDWMKNLDW